MEKTGVLGPEHVGVGFGLQAMNPATKSTEATTLIKSLHRLIAVHLFTELTGIYFFLTGYRIIVFGTLAVGLVRYSSSWLPAISYPFSAMKSWRRCTVGISVS